MGNQGLENCCSSRGPNKEDYLERRANLEVQPHKLGSLGRDYSEPRNLIEQTNRYAKFADDISEVKMMDEMEGGATRIINDREKIYMEFNANSMAKLFYETEERAGYSKKMDKTNLQMFINDTGPIQSEVPLVKTVFFFDQQFTLAQVAASLQNDEIRAKWDPMLESANLQSQSDSRRVQVVKLKMKVDSLTSRELIEKKIHFCICEDDDKEDQSQEFIRKLTGKDKKQLPGRSDSRHISSSQADLSELDLGSRMNYLESDSNVESMTHQRPGPDPRSTTYYSYYASCTQDASALKLLGQLLSGGAPSDGSNVRAETLFGMYKFEAVPIAQNGFDILSEVMSLSDVMTEPENRDANDERCYAKDNIPMQVRVTILQQIDLKLTAQEMQKYRSDLRRNTMQFYSAWVSWLQQNPEF